MRPNRQVKISSGYFDTLGVTVAEAIHLMTKGKDRLTSEEAQAIKILCDWCINSYDYRDRQLRIDAHPEVAPNEHPAEEQRL
jgi:hypothetical protein